MKRLFALFCLCAALATISVPHLSALPKVYPKVSVKDIMTLSADSLKNGNLRSLRYGDTVLVTGLVTVSPLGYPAPRRAARRASRAARASAADGTPSVGSAIVSRCAAIHARQFSS